MTSLSHDIKKDLDILNDIDTSIATLYQGRLVTNVNFDWHTVTCSKCGHDSSSFKFILHVLYDTIAKELYQCQSCGSYIVTNYPYTDKPYKTFDNI